MYEDFEKRRKEIEEYFENQKLHEINKLNMELKKAELSAKENLESHDKAYSDRENDLAVQYERNRRNFNRQAALRGINSGSASQAELSRNGAYLRAGGNLKRDRMSARERGLRELSALREDYAQKSRDREYENSRSMARSIESAREKHTRDMLSQAATLAKYGDFSLYAELYGKAEAENMEAVWLRQNPNLAFSMGKLTLEQYRSITGKNPPGYGGGYGGGRRKKKKEETGEVRTPKSYGERPKPGGKIHRQNMEW